MGVVAKCTHLGLNEHVAIKMLRQDVLLDRDATERFMREAQSASKLRSEHVARVVDVGTFPDTGVPYMIMEFLDGHDLGDLVDDRGALQPPFATMLMLQAAEALAEAHSIGIVHRDVKPSNLFVSWRPDGSALLKVLDFGISKAPSGTDMKLTQTQSLLGTPAYMSPEQMRSARLVDARTDIWSLGTVFYELLEGRRPFEADSFSEMCVKVAVDPPTPMVNTPPALQAIILRCLAKSPDQRYINMAELGRDLLPHVQDVHQASLLVDRMQRVLGRAARASGASGDQWEGPSTGVGRTPILVRDPASAPIAVPWHPTSEPFGSPIATPSPFANSERSPDPRAPSATIRGEASKPARSLSEAIASPQAPKKSKLPLIFLAALAVLGIGVGAVVAMGMRDDKKATKPAGGSTVVVPAVPGPAAELGKTGDGKTGDGKTGDGNTAAGVIDGKPGDGDGKPVDAKPLVGADGKPVDGTPVVGATVDGKPAGDGKGSGAIKPRPVTRPRPTIQQPRPKPPEIKKDPAKDPKQAVPPPGDGSAKPVVKTPECPVYARLPSGACPKK